MISFPTAISPYQAMFLRACSDPRLSIDAINVLEYELRHTVGHLPTAEPTQAASDLEMSHTEYEAAKANLIEHGYIADGDRDE